MQSSIIILIVLMAVVCGPVVYVARLYDRLEQVESRVAKISSGVVDVANRMANAVLRPTPEEFDRIKAKDTTQALGLIEDSAIVYPDMFQRCGACCRSTSEYGWCTLPTKPD